MTSPPQITLDDPVDIITESGQTYRAEVEEGVVTVSYEDNERWRHAGEGAWDGSAIVDFNDDLGEDGYDHLNEAIKAARAG